MSEFMAQDADQRQFAVGIELKATLVDQDVAARARLVREKGAGEVVPVHIHRAHIEDHIGIGCVAGRVLRGHMNVLYVRNLFPRAPAATISATIFVCRFPKDVLTQ